MGKHAQIVMGPAGSGKSTYCNAIAKHCEQIGRTVHIVNLDPAAEHFEYPVAIDIRDLISLKDVIEVRHPRERWRQARYCCRLQLRPLFDQIR